MPCAGGSSSRTKGLRTSSARRTLSSTVLPGAIMTYCALALVGDGSFGRLSPLYQRAVSAAFGLKGLVIASASSAVAHALIPPVLWDHPRP
jgi:hypothetical protein